MLPHAGDWRPKITCGIVVAVDPTSARTGPAETDDDRRWAEAVSALGLTPDGGARWLRPTRLLTWSWVLALAVLALAGGLLLAVLSTDELVPDPGPSGGWEAAGLVVQGAGLTVMLGYGLVAWRSGLFRAAWSRPAAVLSRAQRRGLLAQVRGRAEADPARLPLARDLARRLVLQHHQLLLFVGVVVQQVGRAIGAPTRSTLVLTAVVTVVLLVGAALTHREARRAGRFLADHPDPASPV
ncbi:hypothetical protein [Modestobacter sp. VKM Ac-2985]|uniref:hypothetical protein n=1 Tax=Modestobacter sp. VKM Ac-2985 TaxID=3004139 RepID=UPI0022AB7944|nr:hypothetical protein [Modestobacter sp. VKM Ac-2985]MCZ2837507.1 hypothetical protein [Modestobacter sp. VKM Ac-2985]